MPHFKLNADEGEQVYGVGELDGQVYIAMGGSCATGGGAEDGQKGEVVVLGKADEFGRGFGREGAGAVGCGNGQLVMSFAIANPFPRRYTLFF